MKTFKQFLNENLASLARIGAAGVGAFISPGVKETGRELGIVKGIRKGIEAVVPQDVLAAGLSPAEEERAGDLGYGNKDELESQKTIFAGLRKDAEYLRGLSPTERDDEMKRREELAVTRSQNAAKVKETMKRLDQIRGVFTDE